MAGVNFRITDILPKPPTASSVLLTCSLRVPCWELWRVICFQALSGGWWNSVPRACRRRSCFLAASQLGAGLCFWKLLRFSCDSLQHWGSRGSPLECLISLLPASLASSRRSSLLLRIPGIRWAYCVTQGNVSLSRSMSLTTSV